MDKQLAEIDQILMMIKILFLLNPFIDIFFLKMEQKLVGKKKQIIKSFKLIKIVLIHH